MRTNIRNGAAFSAGILGVIVAFIAITNLAPVVNPGGTGATGPAGPSGSPGPQGSPGPNTIASTTAILKGDNLGGAVAATANTDYSNPAGVQALIDAALTGIAPQVLGTANLTCDTDGDPTVTVNETTGVLNGATITFDGDLSVTLAVDQNNAFYVIPMPLFNNTGITAFLSSKATTGFVLGTNISTTPITFDIAILRLSQ